MIDEVLGRAAEQPEAIAITWEGQEWTYEELARQIAVTVDRIRATGLEPGARIAVQGPASFETVAAILAAWLEGAVVLLLDPLLPEARQHWMLQASGVEYLLHDRMCLHDPDLTCLRLDAAGEAIAIQPPDREGPAYICFTSGSTGTPKGILGQHSSLSHFLDWQRRTFAVGPGDRVAQLTGFSFDVVLRDLFLPLTSGATLCLPPRMFDRNDPWEWLASEKITRLHAVPSLASHWLDELQDSHVLPHLVTTFFAGEPLTDHLVRRWREATGPAAEVVNLYGPTETTLAKCWYRVPETPTPGVQPIGTPLPGCEVSILDADALCADGQTGEIVIRTPYRTLGYLGEASFPPRPFTANPLSGEMNAADLVYRTGDLGRRRADGLLEIFGRLDDQIKIRGVRIEPQEVIATLVSHPAVQAAFVMRHPEHNDQLLGYVSAKAAETSPADLLRFASLQLPLSLVPRQIFLLEDGLPLNANGKVDRSALPLPEQARSTALRSPPETPTEKDLAAIWRELLGVEQLYRDDNFFHLGGHSLMAARLLNRIRDVWSLSLKLQAIFEHHRLCDLAQAIEKGARHRAPDDDDQLVILSRDEPLEASFSQQRLWLQSRLEPEKGVYNIPGAIRFHGCVDPELLQRALDWVVARQESFRTSFVSERDHVEQRIEPTARLELRRVPQADEETAHALALADARAPFDLDRAPLARVLWIPLSDQESILAYTLHHTIADGHSNVRFIRELQHATIAFVRGEEPSLAPLPFQYADYTRWEQARIQAKREDQLAYWEQQLRSAPPRLELPAESNHVVGTTTHSGASTRTLPRELSVAVLRYCRERSVTPFMALLSAFDILLVRLSGQSDICVGTPVANRHLSGSENLVGCFINTLVIRAEVDSTMTYDALLTQIKTRTLQAFDHSEVPFEEVVRRVAPRRDPANHPLFQVLINVLYHEKTLVATEALRMEREWYVDPETKFAMTLYVRQTPDDLHLHLVYDQDLFAQDTVAGWLEDFESILSRCLEDPQRCVRELGEQVSPTPSVAPRRSPAPAGPPIEPMTLTEQRAAGIWRDVLEAPVVKRNANFFEQGGHSLLALRVLYLFQARHGVVVPPALFFQNPVLSDFASAVDRHRAPELPPLLRGGATACSRGQDAIWHYQQQNRDSCAYHVPRALRVLGPLDPEILQEAVDQILERHATLRSVVVAGEAGLETRVLPDARVVVHVEQESDRQVSEPRHIEHEAKRPFDLTREVPLRIRLLKWSDDDWTLLMNSHHIAADCWSMGQPFQVASDSQEPWNPGVFLSEVFEVYRGLQTGVAPQLPPLAVEYADLADWWENNQSAGVYEAHAQYWRDQLQGAPFAVPLPVDKPRPTQFDHSGARRAFPVPEGLYSKVVAHARQRDTTPFIVLLSTYAQCIQDWANLDDFVVGVPVSNRQRLEVRDMVGLVSETLLVRMRLAETEDSTALLKRLTQTVHEAYCYQDYPSSLILRDLCDDPDPSYPDIQLRFSMQQVDETPKPIPGLQVTPLGIDRGISRHDLSLVMVVHGDKLRGWYEFNTNIFDKKTLDELATRYVNRLQQVVSDPGAET